jgi:hypothetical protein
VEKPQGAENSALKNTAPINATPFRISENASMSFFWTRGKSLQTCGKTICARWTLDQFLRTPGNGRSGQYRAQFKSPSGTTRNVEQHARRKHGHESLSLEGID